MAIFLSSSIIFISTVNEIPLYSSAFHNYYCFTILLIYVYDTVYNNTYHIVCAYMLTHVYVVWICVRICVYSLIYIDSCVSSFMILINHSWLPAWLEPVCGTKQNRTSYNRHCLFLSKGDVFEISQESMSLYYSFMKRNIL